MLKANLAGPEELSMTVEGARLLTLLREPDLVFSRLQAAEIEKGLPNDWRVYHKDPNTLSIDFNNRAVMRLYLGVCSIGGVPSPPQIVVTTFLGRAHTESRLALLHGLVTDALEYARSRQIVPMGNKEHEAELAETLDSCAVMAAL